MTNEQVQKEYDELLENGETVADVLSRPRSTWEYILATGTSALITAVTTVLVVNLCDHIANFWQQRKEMKKQGKL